MQALKLTKHCLTQQLNVAQLQAFFQFVKDKQNKSTLCTIIVTDEYTKMCFFDILSRNLTCDY